MAESATCRKLRDEIIRIRVGLEELIMVLSSDEPRQAPINHEAPDAAQAKFDFFEQITRGEQMPEDEDLLSKVLAIITELGYASTIVLQHRLELNFRQASAILADLERDGLVGPAHGFRPHKVLPAAYEVLERIEGRLHTHGG
jgi:DNA segregation ATPase FtsK/SpoIIIE-like protein